ncbi:acyl-CoA dehydratase activase [Thermocaproicibacter melissae]|uniref:acyl-CoA dehydratase activase n=1 Tax=Thermocaproicibacter melissae TaxID=2966552 RepID=UPI0024B1F57F|nr:acyl-CoA dehydratase activase [Thermocaproicibacter melissae]WBY63932.1 acyl-CoA dehydratase activase [Thermocaproicibacter melissae]
MIGYVCKYTPVEVLRAMGADPVLMEPSVNDFNLADTLLYPNICSYVKSVLEDAAGKDYEGFVLTSCCDSVRRLYDVLRARYPKKFLFMLDLPRFASDAAAGLYAGQIRKMMEAYAAFSGRQFDENVLREIMLCNSQYRHPEYEPNDPNVLRIALVGNRCSNGLRNLMQNCGVKIVADLTCAGAEREFSPPAEGEDLILNYTKQLLKQMPCLRMGDISARQRHIDEVVSQTDGVIYHTVKFCDIYSYEYSTLHRRISVPLLKIETDTTPQCAGQIRTRVEAFLESLAAAKGIKPVDEKQKQRGENSVTVVGIDSGSTSTNAVVMNEKKEILASGSIRTGAKTSVSAEKILNDVLKKAGIARTDVSMIVSTGYGRVSIPFADKSVTEISCHAKGARYFCPHVRTILDIGGQDSKAIRLSETGEVEDFVMNDKCAAGTGRFLEAMARTLELDISELGPVSLKSQETVEISSMCTVFAESEVISLIAQNKEKADIAKGVHRAIAGKACSLLSRVGGEPTYMMTGGVAKNQGVVQAVEEKLGAKLFLCKDPEIVGAVGAALFGLESFEKA